MKILALVTSYRKHGNTARIVQMIETQMEAIAARRDEPLAFETLYLAHQDIQPCRGCRTCFDQGEERCPLKDDLPAVKAAMDAADGIIAASPVYVNDVNGVAKNWMDRLAYICHRPALAGKCAYLVATVGGGPTSRTLRTMDLALRSWGFYIVGQAGYKMGALMDREAMENRYQAQTTRAAEALFHAVAQEQFTRPSFLSLMMFKIQQLSWQQKSPDSYDHTYLKNRGWLEPGREFYIEQRAGRVKVALARLAGSVLARFVT